MLVLTRKKNESILIGDCEVMIVKVAGDKVRLGIRAAKDVRVLRKELVGNDAETPKKVKSYTARSEVVREDIEDDCC